MIDLYPSTLPAIVLMEPYPQLFLSSTPLLLLRVPVTEDLSWGPPSLSVGGEGEKNKTPGSWNISSPSFFAFVKRWASFWFPKLYRLGQTSEKEYIKNNTGKQEELLKNFILEGLSITKCHTKTNKKGQFLFWQGYKLFRRVFHNAEYRPWNVRQKTNKPWS